MFGAIAAGVVATSAKAITCPGSLLRVEANCNVDWAVPLQVFEIRGVLKPGHRHPAITDRPGHHRHRIVSPVPAKLRPALLPLPPDRVLPQGQFLAHHIAVGTRPHMAPQHFPDSLAAPGRSPPRRDCDRSYLPHTCGTASVIILKSNNHDNYLKIVPCLPFDTTASFIGLTRSAGRRSVSDWNLRSVSACAMWKSTMSNDSLANRTI